MQFSLRSGIVEYILYFYSLIYAIYEKLFLWWPVLCPTAALNLDYILIIVCGKRFGLLLTLPSPPFFCIVQKCIFKCWRLGRRRPSFDTPNVNAFFKRTRADGQWIYSNFPIPAPRRTRVLSGRSITQALTMENISEAEGLSLASPLLFACVFFVALKIGKMCKVHFQESRHPSHQRPSGYDGGQWQIGMKIHFPRIFNFTS